MSLTVGEERFSLTGKKVTEPGFTAIISWQAVPAEESLPQLNQGDRLTVKEVRTVHLKLDILCDPHCLNV